MFGGVHQLPPSNLTLDDPEEQGSTSKSFDSKYLENGDRYEVGSHLYAEPRGFRLAPSDLTLDDLQGSKTKVILVDVKCREWQELRCWTQRRLYRVPMGFTLDAVEMLKVKVIL